MFSKNEVDINDKDESVVTGSKRGFLHVLNMNVPERSLHSSLKTWHACLGRALPKTFKQKSLTMM